MINWIVVAAVVLNVLKDLSIGLVGGLLLTASVLCVETLTDRWRR